MPSKPFHHYNKRLRNYANENRHTMTRSAARMWKHVLRNRKMRGYQFRRERPVLHYIADFACLPLKLIIEVYRTRSGLGFAKPLLASIYAWRQVWDIPNLVDLGIDGITHHDPQQIAYDHRRDALLAEIGFTTLRFDSLEVFRDVEGVAEKIGQWIDEHAQVPPPPPRRRRRTTP